MITKRLRYEILRRDGHRCRYCGTSADDAKLAVDHVVPTALGGSDDPTNLAAACHDCNAGKSSMPADAPIVEDVAHDARRWAAAMALAGYLAQQRLDDLADKVDAFNDEWEKWCISGTQRCCWRPSDYEESVERWLRLGLSERDLFRCIRTTMGKKLSTDQDARWKYFCGVAWKTVKARQEEALEFVRLAERDPDGDVAHGLDRISTNPDTELEAA